MIRGENQIKKILFENKPKPKKVKVISVAKQEPASFLLRVLHEGTDSDEAVETYNLEYAGHLRVLKKVYGFRV